MTPIATKTVGEIAAETPNAFCNVRKGSFVGPLAGKIGAQAFQPPPPWLAKSLYLTQTRRALIVQVKRTRP